jgi:hypothetical protein
MGDDTKLEVFEMFERHFAKALPGATCAKVVVVFKTADGDIASVRITREGHDDVDDE